MSHVVKMELSIKDPKALEAACKDLSAEVIAIDLRYQQVSLRWGDGTTQTIKYRSDSLHDLHVGQRLSVTVNPHETVTFFDRTVVTGTAIRLPGWRYPIVIPDDKALHGNKIFSDDYQGHWGDMKVFHRMKHLYAVHVGIQAARKMGRTVVGRVVTQTATGTRTRIELA